MYIKPFYCIVLFVLACWQIFDANMGTRATNNLNPQLLATENILAKSDFDASTAQVREQNLIQSTLSVSASQVYVKR